VTVSSWLGVTALGAFARAQPSAPAAGTPVEPPPVPAAPDESRATHLHAFVSQGAIKSTDNNYLAESERGSFEMTEVGINVTKGLSDQLRVGLQLFARDLGPLGDYSAKFDWFYLDYRHADWLGVRAGRVRLPFGLYNEINDIDAARVPVLLPQSIYSTRNRDFLLAQTGMEIYGYLSLLAAGGLEYRLYGGTIFLDVEDNLSVLVQNLEVPYVVGGRLMWDTFLEGLRLGGSLQALRIDFDVLSSPMPGAPPVPGQVKLPVVLWVASLEYGPQDLLLAAEYGRWQVKRDSMAAGIVSSDDTQERAYLMAAYRLGRWFTPGLYVSAFYPNVDDRDGRDAYQHDFAATIRLDLGAHWLLKLEAHFMHGTAELLPALNGGVPRSMLTENWGLFLAKTTAYF
jgi:hypothetical protein